MCLVSLSFSIVRENLSKSISLISGLFTLTFLFIKLNVEDRLFQELMQCLYIHFNPKVVVLNGGM